MRLSPDTSYSAGFSRGSSGKSIPFFFIFCQPWSSLPICSAVPWRNGFEILYTRRIKAWKPACKNIFPSSGFSAIHVNCIVVKALKRYHLCWLAAGFLLSKTDLFNAGKTQTCHAMRVVDFATVDNGSFPSDPGTQFRRKSIAMRQKWLEMARESWMIINDVGTIKTNEDDHCGHWPVVGTWCYWCNFQISWTSVALLTFFLLHDGSKQFPWHHVYISNWETQTDKEQHAGTDNTTENHFIRNLGEPEPRFSSWRCTIRKSWLKMWFSTSQAQPPFLDLSFSSSSKEICMWCNAATTTALVSVQATHADISLFVYQWRNGLLSVTMTATTTTTTTAT